MSYYFIFAHGNLNQKLSLIHSSHPWKIRKSLFENLKFERKELLHFSHFDNSIYDLSFHCEQNIDTKTKIFFWVDSTSYSTNDEYLIFLRISHITNNLAKCFKNTSPNVKRMNLSYYVYDPWGFKFHKKPDKSGFN